MELTHAVVALAALAQQTRLSIYRLLVQAGKHGLPVGEIGAAVRSAGATLSFHLAQLTRAGLIRPRQEGRYIFYCANYAQMNDLLAFLTENCCAGEKSAAPSRPAKRGKQIRRNRAAERPATRAGTR
jgi:ArsR family transcriptional regulator, arsenate/arsenite/antimonite-responsive transcriptional repressor